MEHREETKFVVFPSFATCGKALIQVRFGCLTYFGIRKTTRRKIKGCWFQLVMSQGWDKFHVDIHRRADACCQYSHSST